MNQGPHVVSHGVCGSTFTPHRNGLLTPKTALHCHIKRRLYVLLYQQFCTLCALLCCVPRRPSLQHCSISKDRPPQSYTDCVLQLPTMEHAKASGGTQQHSQQNACELGRWRTGSTRSHANHVTNSRGLKYCLISTGTWVCIASLLTCVCSLCCQHCSHMFNYLCSLQFPT